MEVLAGVVEFFLTWENWTGDAGILVRTAEHIGLSALALAVAGVAAIPVAVWLGHLGRGGVHLRSGLGVQRGWAL